MKKPSERIKEIRNSLKIIDGQNPEDPNFEGMTFMEEAILQYLDEKELGTAIENRLVKCPPIP